MDETLLCSCGAMLLSAVSERGVTPVGADQEIPFRRATDHVICSECFRSYPVRELAERLGISTEPPRAG